MMYMIEHKYICIWRVYFDAYLFVSSDFNR